MEFIIEGRYKLGECLGKGSFGSLYAGKNIKSNEAVAIKLEPLKTMAPQLQYESKILQNLKHGTGFPQVYWSGVQGEFYCMIMTILGPNLRQLFDFCEKRFTLKTILSIGIQMLQRLEFLHDMGYLHRDLKPENICIGQGKRSNLIHLIDFGLVKRFICPITGLHLKPCKNKGVIGTSRFLSRNAHLGNQ